MQRRGRIKKRVRDCKCDGGGGGRGRDRERTSAPGDKNKAQGVSK